ncbi:hypothetical protein MUU53_22990 [Rhizobium lemnae]|uniref:Uncharacterized protein n=1 Tax=Rhizobium lemnae TaxID=1214924 RepID=A0ABV8ECS3_9HYPH|nr:hypothetical protein [Rhizobium lemnae]MCJ8510709.1 hypothetical protein [Rhizobium lemnae]
MLEVQTVDDAGGTSANVDVPIFGDEETTHEGQAIRGLCRAVYPLSCIGILWTETVKNGRPVQKINTFLGVLGAYVGSVGTTANLSALDDRPNDMWGSFLIVRRDSLILMSLQEAMLRLHDFCTKYPERINEENPIGLCEFMENGRMPSEGSGL